MLQRRNLILGAVGILLIIVIALQLVPGYARTNPPITRQIEWNSAETEQLMRGTCMDCHSNETVWPWYAQIAPVSWLVVNDVNEGRSKFNLSEVGSEIESDEMIEEIEKGDMPLPNYVLLHPDANLNETQKATLMDGIRATFGRGD
jgi:hypothetical protein